MSDPPLTHPASPVASCSDSVKRDDQHKHRRRFVGPMPERIVDPTSRTRSRRPRDTEEEDAGVRAAIREHALQFFIGHGGRREDWGESQEHSVREEMYTRWKQSEWGRARQRKREAKYDRQWIGTSFDVGIFLGVDVLAKGSTPHAPSAASTSRPGASVGAESAGADTFVTAPSMPQASSSTSFLHPDGDRRPDSQESTTPLLEDSAELPAIRVNDTPWTGSSRSFNTNGAIQTEEPESMVPPSKGKRATVHFADQRPAPPHEVLGRTGEDVEETSAGAAWQASVENQVEWGDVIMRDRMLVQVSFTNSATLGANFDEAQNRVTPHIQYNNWQEYIVAWRKNRLELYKDHATPCKEWLTGHKHLAFVIPLSQAGTKLSLYSFTDFTFCITCPPHPVRARSRRTSRWLLYGTTKGTNIFIFNVKARTRAADWMWQLWRRLGGELPPSVEIRCPILDTRMRIDIPGNNDGDIQEVFTVFTPENTVNLCNKVLRNVEDYNEIIIRANKEGIPFGLAWRMGTNLDWIWQTDDVEGKARGWAVLSRLPFKQGKTQAHLELRLKEHRPTRVRLRDGTRMDEPPGLEGFVDRIRPTSQTKQAMYLTSHDGYLFFLAAAQAFPPRPPGLPSGPADPSDNRRSEALRGTQQILHAAGMTDLRNVAAVRRAFQVVPMQTDLVAAQEAAGGEDTEAFWAQAENFEEDLEDVGGEEGLVKAPDRSQRRMRRSFELLLTSGRVIRFETYSCQHGLEWISRLRPLISYWRRRHEADAKNEMELLYASTGRPRITPLKHVDPVEDLAPPTPPNPDESSPDLTTLYNWCVLDGCRAISKSGRLFSRKGLRGRYNQVQLVLLSGHLVEFNITKASLYHRRGNVIYLLDAYVCSGYFAAQHLPEGQYDPDAPPLAHRYQDGLESDDRDEDTLFMVWWYPKTADAADSVPPLSGKRRISVFRTRSRLERDAWVWAVKSEVEKVVRAARDREERVRAAGELLKTRRTDLLIP